MAATDPADKLVDADPETGAALIRICACGKCGHRSFPPVLLGCERCGAGKDALTQTSIKARGTLLASVEVPGTDGTFVVGSVKLDDGPAIRALMEGTAEIGTPLTGRLTEIDERTTVIFGASG